MSKFKDAKLAAEQYVEYLKEMGAHSVGFTQINEGCAVVAYAVKLPDNAPDHLVLKENSDIKIPLQWKIINEFKPESLT